MQVRVLLMRRSGVLMVVRKSRDCTEHESTKVRGLLEMPRGTHLTLRSVTSSPGSCPLAELFAPTLLAWESSCVHVRGLELMRMGERDAGVLQEWLIWPG